VDFLTGIRFFVNTISLEIHQKWLDMYKIIS
jgi:hypothetical protein